MSKKISINVTINGNPVCVRPSRMVLSDLEQIKKNERERRRRLRLEQVRQISKDLASKLLKRAKHAAATAITTLENDSKSELKKMHDMRIMEIQRKYQEDMEDIGYAHCAAACQPNIDAIIEADEEKNRVAAVERGKEAMQRLKETHQKEDPVVAHQERLRQVREIENVRSSMVSKLSKKNESSNRETEIYPDEDEIIVENEVSTSAQKKKQKKVNGKKSPAKVVSKSNIKISSQKTKSPRRTVVEVHQKSAKSPKRSTSSRSGKVGNKSTENVVKSKTGRKHSATATTEVECTNINCNRDTDDQEPRKTVPRIGLTPTKADKVARYNPDDYKQKSSASSSSSSSVSDDSSYFSDSCGEILSKATSKPRDSREADKVQVYDHSTRYRNSYDQPLGLVERTDIRNEPNAMEAAREVIEAENRAANLAENRRLASQKRSEDALLRESVRRNYEEMLKNSENMARNEQLERETVCVNQRTVDSRRQTCQPECCKTAQPVCDIILHDTPQPGPSRIQNLVERAEKTHSHEEHVHPTVCIHSSRRDERHYERPVCCAGHDSVEEICEVWKKFERQKRRLLREFGPDLPSTIVNASMTRLFDNRQTSTNEQTQKVVPPAPKQASPEIKVINMSSSDDSNKKPSTSKKKSKKTAKSSKGVSKTTEMAVQTSTMDENVGAKDKGVQVEILTEDTNESKKKVNKTSESPPSDDSPPSERLEYVEPRVIVLTPDVGDSSSGSSISREVVIELENHQVKVTPRKRKTSSEKKSKRRLSPARSKPRSLPSSHPGSPVKKHPTSAPSSRSGSPKKREVRKERSRSRSPEKTVDIIVKKRTVKVQTPQSDPIHIVHESSVESTMPSTSPEEQDNSISSGKPYRIIKHPTVKKVIETSRETTSDASTSYASLPPRMAYNIPLSRHQITPILEMLDSSANESIRAVRANVSPVSTPETPSPRTMNVPSNIPHPERISRLLRFGNSSSLRTDDESFCSTTHNGQQSSSSRKRDRQLPTQPHVDSRHSDKSINYCSCVNPFCESVHRDINNINTMAKNHPVISEKFEDLQNVYTERIASLTELIRRVRNEQHGMEFSTVSTADETSLMQLPPPQPFRSDFQSVQRLVESIEAIHSKLARTLRESQKIITDGVRPEAPTSSISSETKTKESTSTSTDETPAVLTSKGKPRVISDEPVKIDLDRLKRGRGPYTTMLVTAESPPWPSPTNPRRHEEIVATLYQELLEQSKTVDNMLESQKTPSPQQNVAKAVSPTQYAENEVTKDERQICGSSPKRPTKDEEFVPLLAGIPKISRALPNVQPGVRPRPPPAGSAYRTEISTPVHELSTIVEFDTPDTVNRSQGSIRSPSGKSRRVLQLQSPGKATSSPRSDRSVKAQAAQTSKQSSSTVSSMTENMARTIPRRLTMRDVGSPDAKFVINSDNNRAISERGTTKSLLSQAPSTSIEGNASRRNGDGKSIECSISGVERDVKDKRDAFVKLQSYENVDARLAALISAQLNIDSGVGQENKNDKLTSTSSHSFSGLSGISDIGSSPTSELAKWASSSEEIETALKKLGLGWAVVTLKKTREASALSSSSNSEMTPANIVRRTKSPSKKQINDDNLCGLPDFSDVSSISIKEASKSTERAVLMKARTSTPNIQISNSTSEKSTTVTASSSGISLQDPSDSLTAPNLSLNANK